MTGGAPSGERWTGQGDFEYEFDYVLSQTPSYVDVKAFMAPRLNFLLYEIAGPYGEVLGYFDLEATGGAWALYGGLEASMGGTVEFFVPGTQISIIDEEIGPFKVVEVRVPIAGSGGGATDDHGNSRSSATPVAAGSSTAGTLTDGDVDYFAVTVSQAGTLTATTTGSTDTVGYLENASGTRLDQNDDGGSGYNFRVSASVSPGTYYIRVRGFGSSTGSYSLGVSFSPSGNTGSDDHGNSRSSATPVAAGSSTAGTLTDGDVDYFAVTVSQAGTLTATTTGSTDTVGYLENASGTRLDQNDDGGSGYNFRVSASVSPGTYYIRVRGFASDTGSYSLGVSFTI